MYKKTTKKAAKPARKTRKPAKKATKKTSLRSFPDLGGAVVISDPSAPMPAKRPYTRRTAPKKGIREDIRTREAAIIIGSLIRLGILRAEDFFKGFSQ
jgi:hypothetical protein